MEEALFRLEIEVVELGNFEDVVDCVAMIFDVCTRGNPNVVHINSDGRAERFVLEDHVTIYVVHHGLEGCWGIGESEIHDCRLEKSVSGFECGFLFVSFADAYIIVSPSDVKLCVYMCIAEVADEVCN